MFAFLLTACADFATGGRTDSDILKRECPHPSEILLDIAGESDQLTRAQSEILAGRLGDELIVCGEEKKILLNYLRGVDSTLRAK